MRSEGFGGADGQPPGGRTDAASRATAFACLPFCIRKSFFAIVAAFATAAQRAARRLCSPPRRSDSSTSTTTATATRSAARSEPTNASVGNGCRSCSSRLAQTHGRSVVRSAPGYGVYPSAPGIPLLSAARARSALARASPRGTTPQARGRGKLSRSRRPERPWSQRARRPVWPPQRAFSASFRWASAELSRGSEARYREAAAACYRREQ